MVMKDLGWWLRLRVRSKLPTIPHCRTSVGARAYIESMPEFCDVALPVPLDSSSPTLSPRGCSRSWADACSCPSASSACPGSSPHCTIDKPTVKTKNIISVLDPAPVLDEQLIQLGHWIADYYLAPIGEVFRTMLPLGAEFKRTIGYRITEQGHMALHQAGMSGSSARSQRTPEDQLTEFRVLDYLAERESRRGKRACGPRPGRPSALLAGWCARMDCPRRSCPSARDGSTHGQSSRS